MTKAIRMHHAKIHNATISGQSISDELNYNVKSVSFTLFKNSKEHCTVNVRVPLS